MGHNKNKGLLQTVYAECLPRVPNHRESILFRNTSKNRISRHFLGNKKGVICTF